MCDKDFAELSGELFGVICLKTLIFYWGSALELFRKFFGTFRAIFWLWGSFLALARIRSKSGPNQVWGEGFGGGRVQRRRSGWKASVAPRKVLNILGLLCLQKSVVKRGR